MLKPGASFHQRRHRHGEKSYSELTLCLNSKPWCSRLIPSLAMTGNENSKVVTEVHIFSF